jgi:hypothetical protein
MSTLMGLRLEAYTLKFPQEVLLVTIEVEGIPDQIAIFKGFSSSLMCQTAFDPEVPMIPDGAEIKAIDRLQGPYNPNSPRYIDRDLSLQKFEPLLIKAGV